MKWCKNGVAGDETKKVRARKARKYGGFKKDGKL